MCFADWCRLLWVCHRDDDADLVVVEVAGLVGMQAPVLWVLVGTDQLATTDKREATGPFGQLARIF